jgi:hypothetical protein
VIPALDSQRLPDSVGNRGLISFRYRALQHHPPHRLSQAFLDIMHLHCVFKRRRYTHTVNSQGRVEGAWLRAWASRISISW